MIPILTQKNYTLRLSLSTRTIMTMPITLSRTSSSSAKAKHNASPAELISVFEMFATFTPGILDEYDMETQSIIAELKEMFKAKAHGQHAQNCNHVDKGPTEKSSKACHQSKSNLYNSRPSVPQQKPLGKMSIQAMVQAMAREAFEPSDVGNWGSNTRAARDFNRNIVPRGKHRPIKHTQRLGTKSQLAQIVGTSSGMAQTTPSSKDGGPLAVTTSDGSIKKFSILPPIENTYPEVVAHSKDIRKERSNENHIDVDYNDPAKYGWNIGNTEKWSITEETGGAQRFKDALEPTSIGYTSGKSPQKKEEANVTTLPNSYVAMSVMTSGQEELKRHLKKQQQQRESDKKEFKAESVNGKTLNPKGTYVIKYGNIEIPTTDVELYAILSVEKHNSPFATEYHGSVSACKGSSGAESDSSNTVSATDRTDSSTNNLTAFPEDKKALANVIIEEKQDSVDVKAVPQQYGVITCSPSTDRLDKSQLIEVDVVQLKEPVVLINTQNNQLKDNDIIDVDFPLVQTQTNNEVSNLPPHISDHLPVKQKAKRKLKHYRLNKCNEGTKPLKSKLLNETLALKPLAPTIPVERIRKSLNQESDIPHVEPIVEFDEYMTKYGKRNISVVLPSVNNEDPDDLYSLLTSPTEGTILDEPEPEPEPEANKTPLSAGQTHRHSYIAPKVITLGSKNNTIASPERSSAASSRSNSSTSSSRRSARQTRYEPKPLDEVDLQMKEKMLTVMGASLTQRPQVSSSSSASSHASRSTTQSEMSSNSSQEHCKRIPSKRMGVTMKKVTSNESYESLNVSMVSVASDPLDTHGSSLHCHGQSQSSERINVPNSQHYARYNIRGEAKDTGTGSLPNLYRPGASATPPVVTGGTHLRVLLPLNCAKTSPDLRMLVSKQQVIRSKMDARSGDQLNRLAKH